MELSFLGGGCIKLSGKGLTLLANPAATEPAQAKAIAKADVILMTGPIQEPLTTEAMVVDSPGEYEIKGAMVTGVPAQLHIDESGHRATIYSVLVDGVNVVVVGNIDPNLEETQIEPLGQVHALVVPVGGHGLTLDAMGAAGIISKLEPTYVIPVHYDDGTTYDMPQDGLDVFLKEMGSNPEPVAKLKINSKELPVETTVVVLDKN